MKNKGDVVEFHKERLDDLMRAYDEVYSSCDYLCMPKIYAATAQMPSKRFWVSDIRAALVVSALLRGEDKLKGMHPQKREMYEEIYRRVLILKQKRPELRVLDLCAIVVTEPAPKFYLTAGSAKMMICKARKKWVEEKIHRLQRI